VTTRTNSGVAAPPAGPVAGGGHGGRGSARITLPVALLLIAAGLIAISFVRVVSGAGDLTSSGQIGGAIAAGVPIALAGLGGLWSERSGVTNIGLEGMMIVGTFFGGWAGWQWGPWAGVVAGVAGGALFGLIHAVATVTFGVDQIISGVAVNILAAGATAYLAKRWFTSGEAAAKGGNPKQSPPIDDIQSWTVPGLSGWLQGIERHHWFLVSDAAGILGGIVTDLSVLTVLSVIFFVATFLVLWKTAFGLRLRSCGENPVAAESLGVNVYRYKYLAVVVSGALAGFGGAFMAVGVHIYSQGQTGGRGFIGLAAMIFGNWRPGGLAFGAGLFGYCDSLQLRGGGPTVHALLLLAALLIAALAAWRAYRKSYLAAGVGGVFAVLLALWYVTTDTMPPEVVQATPYIITLVVLAVSAQRLRMPKAGGIPYRKGQGT
jgi:general nucleoside transport system permease protein